MVFGYLILISYSYDGWDHKPSPQQCSTLPKEGMMKSFLAHDNPRLRARTRVRLVMEWKTAGKSSGLSGGASREFTMFPSRGCNLDGPAIRNANRGDSRESIRAIQFAENGRAPKYRTKGCSRCSRPKFAARKWLQCYKNQCSRSRAVNAWAWTPFCVILWGWLRKKKTYFRNVRAIRANHLKPAIRANHLKPAIRDC